MTAPEERDLDLVLWGATGYTGRLVARYLVRSLSRSPSRNPSRGRSGTPEPLAWALAGRSREKLEALRDELTDADPDARHLPLLVADALDPDSLEPLVRRTRVVCTTVGPYARYGTPLVELCARHGTDCCDLTGEVPWMRRTVERFHDRAAAAGARIVHCCGFDSIPSDLGTLLTHRALERAGSRLRRNRLRVRSTRGRFSGGTVASLFEILKEAREDRAVRRILVDPYALNPENERAGPDGRDRMRPHLDDDRGMWTGPFLMAGINTRIVRRSNALLGYPYGRDFRYDEAMDTGRGVGGRVRAEMLSAGLAAFTAGAALPPTAWLLRSFVLPSPGEGPTAEERARGYFRIVLYGEGEPAEPAGPPVRVETTVSADRDPGYGATCRMLAESALCLARGEAEGLPGGVLTPASGLGLPLVDRLRQAGITLEARIEAGAPPSPLEE
ncbi:MAG: saccharopine dehydrogenase NADP-binding domain-containing protein [Acidobacteriota bacterium]|jgi:short subunit dehydrogenase-like uncharacterized protein